MRAGRAGAHSIQYNASMTGRGPIAIVTSEGGMKCAYSGGALTALTRLYPDFVPDVYVSSSGSVANMLYFLAGQANLLERAWTRFLASRQVIRYFPFPKFDLDYLVNVLFREIMPLDEERLNAAKTRWFVPVTDSDLGSTSFVSNESWLDPYEIMRAAKAIPFFSSGGIWLGSHRYVDGGIGTDCESLVDRAILAGAKRIILISNVSRSWGALAWPMRMYARTRSHAMRELMRKDAESIERAIEPHGVELIHLTPSYPLPVGLITRNKRRVAEAFHMGYDDFMAKRPEIERLLKP